MSDPSQLDASARTRGKSGCILAFDLGATSGRAMAARFSDGLLTLQEIRRFPNNPIEENATMRWDVRALFSEMQTALRSLVNDPPVSIGVDAWGVDYALIGEDGELLEKPYHYRDRRTEGMVERVTARVGRARIYETTGIQFMPINTLYQLAAAAEQTPALLKKAKALLTIPDLMNYWLTGRICCEYTNASTTQFLDQRTRDWSRDLLHDLDIPTHLLAPIVAAGTVLGPCTTPGFTATPVIAPACHDTGSAVAAVRSGGRTAFLSSGTWSLLGSEVPQAIAGRDALHANFTNEGGVCGTVRLLKNITGMWLLEGCRKVWGDFSWAELMAMSAASATPFEHLVDPDDASFTRPSDMCAAIAGYCERTGQRAPSTSGAFVRAIFESLAFKYRYVLEQLESLTGTNVDEIRVIGGGSQHAVLNQTIASATGRRVLAGPAEATALGNVAMQMVGAGVVASLDEARDAIERSFPPIVFAPDSAAPWQQGYEKFRSLIR